jgi:hypothetical protein
MKLLLPDAMDLIPQYSVILSSFQTPEHMNEKKESVNQG